MNEIEIFNAAVKLSLDERAKFLDLACKANPVEASVAETVLAASLSAIATWRRNTEVLPRRIFGALCFSVSPWFK